MASIQRISTLCPRKKRTEYRILDGLRANPTHLLPRLRPFQLYSRGMYSVGGYAKTPRLRPCQLPCAGKCWSINAGRCIHCIGSSKSGMSSTRSVMMLGISCIPRASRNLRFTFTFGRTVSITSTYGIWRGTGRCTTRGMPHGSSRHAVCDRTYDVRCSVARCMISLRTVKKLALCSWRAEMCGATNAVDPQTGRNVEDPVPLRQSIDWLSNARPVSSRMKVGASGEGT